MRQGHVKVLEEKRIRERKRERKREREIEREREERVMIV